jgi:hypothetical protein
VIAVTQAINLSPGIGWVRGDEAIDPKMLQDLERIRAENDQLKARLFALESEDVTFPSKWAGPNEEFEFSITPNFGQEPSMKATSTWGKLFFNEIEQILR